MNLPQLNLQHDLSRLVPVTHRLTEHGYHEQAIAELLGLWDLSELSGAQYAQYCWRCRADKSPLSLLVSAFLLGLPGTKARFDRLLGEEGHQALLDSGLMVENEGLYSSLCAIYPCLGRFIFTDHWACSDTQEQGKVYELGTDSYVLARVTPRTEGRALDLCTGSGVHAVHSAAQHTSSAVDINPRALAYTQLNAAAQNLKVSTHLGDLYAPTNSERFHLITANPPFVPSPDREVLIHRSAGETGEEVPERLVAGLPEKLEIGGLFSMVLEHPVLENETYLDRLERWLGENSGWGIAVLDFREYPVPQYVLQHLGGVADQEAAYNDYLQSYQRLGIRAMRFANVFIKRLPYQNKNWKVLQHCPWPNKDISEQVEEWLDSLSTYHDPSWQPDPQWRPSLNPRFTDLWVNAQGEKATLELAEETWLQADALDREELQLLRHILESQANVEELSEQDVSLEILRRLGLKRAIV